MLAVKIIDVFKHIVSLDSTDELQVVVMIVIIRKALVFLADSEKTVQVVLVDDSDSLIINPHHSGVHNPDTFSCNVRPFPGW